MAYRHCVALAAMVLASCGPPPGTAGTDPEEITHPALRDELLRMGMLDQTARVGMTVRSFSDTSFARASLVIDSALTRRLRRLVDEHGWPAWSMVGRPAASAAFLIVQHSPSDAFQRRMLPELEAAAAAGEADPSDVAMLTDRLLTHDGRPQRYGTQFRIVDDTLVPYPVEDPAGLARRRAAAGLMPIDEYIRLLEQMYQGPVRWPAGAAAAGDSLLERR